MGGCLHVDKNKMLTNYVLVAYKNVEGHGYGPLDFHVPTKALCNLQEPITEGFEDRWSRTPSLEEESRWAHI